MEELVLDMERWADSLCLLACLEDEPATITTRGSRLSKNYRSDEFQVRYEFILGHNGMRRLGTILIGSNAKKQKIE